MKTLFYSFAFVVLTAALFACNPNSKADTWNPDQKKKWKTECKSLLMKNGEREATAADYCDCIYEKMSAKYTPEEAANLTIEQEREIWDECDYSW
jgi:hypothetical protein